jgi:hypothetical protein
MAQAISPSTPLSRTPLLVRLLLGPPSALANSTRVWLVLVAFLGVVNLFITYVGAGLESDPRAQLFSWPVIVVVGLLGLAGIWLSHRTGFPAAWDARISNRQRLVIPAVLGIGFGLLQAGLDLVFHWTQFFAQFSGLQAFNAPWPGSLLFYPGGAIWIEVFYRLLPVPLLLWLVSSLLLRGRAQTQVFWVLAVLSSLIEPTAQDLDGLRFGASVLFVASQFIPDFLFNLTQAVLFRNYGFVASIVTRVAMYLIWHVTYGNFICRC